ncbi:uncharacterized protein FIBRA_02584 [Fibroporia radiculosa]|uniref:PIPK domain-containing protein n=1 Tax=Fibroporia radiculosa TaxID=599839 RepID=J4GMZ7_9APHY|nr:uncharacterized protein FIBRA_02584 [Fibroporia radiculosa]CCM00550.1 predicted protein [Fibroporia radiculosa]
MSFGGVQVQTRATECNSFFYLHYHSGRSALVAYRANNDLACILVEPMSHHGDKPLPALPYRGTLTVESRSHLRRLVLCILEEEGITSQRETFADVLKRALQELGECISTGGWLTGFRRARTIRRRNPNENSVRQSPERAMNQDEEKTKNKQGRRTEYIADTELDTKSKYSESQDSSHSLQHTLPTALAQLRELVQSNSAQLIPKPSAKHLLLIADGYNSTGALVSEEVDYGTAGINCAFIPRVFDIPSDTDVDGRGGSVGTVLCGLNEWDVRLFDNFGKDSVQIVGGTFRIKGAASALQHAALCRVLRVSLYAYLSLLLEQQLLLNSHVQLHFPRPSLSTAATMPEHPPPPEDSRRPQRDGSMAGGIWSYFSKKTESLLHRAVNAGPSLRRGSLDLPLTRTLQPPAPSCSIDGTREWPRRFSFRSPVSTRRVDDHSEGVSKDRPFLAALRRIEEWRDLLSTTPEVMLPLPSVLVGLVEKENQDPGRRLAGDEKAELMSVLGWEGKKNLGRAMTGLPGFVRHQGISVLFSTHIPLPLIASSPSAQFGPGSSIFALPSCGNRKKWVTYRYYRRGHGEVDEALGEIISSLCSTGEEPCDKLGCHFKRADHDLRWMHGGIRIVATITSPSSLEDGSVDRDMITMWEACSVCGRSSCKEPMLDGTFLISFGKYLELLIYSPAICILSPTLCEHTTPPPRPWTAEDSPLPRTRFNIHRKFAYKSRIVTFSLSVVEDVFELYLPRLKIMRRKVSNSENGKHDVSDPAMVIHAGRQNEDEDGRRILRREIMSWWQGLSEHMDKVEEWLVADTHDHPTKALPRLPSDDDAYDDFAEAELTTPRPSTKRLPSSSSISSASISASGTVHADRGCSPDSVISTIGTFSSHETRSIDLLAGLRHTFQREEQALYVELSRTPTTSLNNIRCSFYTAARGASRRLSAWEAKHSSQLPPRSSANCLPNISEPEWWRSGCHAVPGSNVIVREDDWGSIIAFTLSSVDYHRELGNMSTAKPRQPTPPAPPSTPPALRPSFFSAGSSFRKLLPGATSQPDPDLDGIVWQEPETFSAVISRKEHPRDPSSLTALREVLRHRASIDLQGAPGGSRFNMTSSSTKPHPVPPSARAKPAVELSMQAADACMCGAPESVDKILHELEAHSNSTKSSGASSPSSSGFVETYIRRGKTASVISTDSEATMGADTSSVSGESRDVEPPPLPAKEPSTSNASLANIHSLDAAEMPTDPPSINGYSIAGSLASAMRYLLKPGGAQPAASGNSHHGLLSADFTAINDRPHIKYDWTVGKRLKFSCTVYFAKQFDALRRRCGIEDVFLKSLTRSENWVADGGKSRSNFWKTADDQFIIKTLVNAWNVADLQVLLELAPSYFRHMDATSTKPSALAKLVGFYTVEIRNLENGTTQAKADLLVMENLFYGQKISKTFDLKGIQGRKVKAPDSSSKTFFDGEWIEGQHRALTLVRPYSKVVLQEAIKGDCDFLARSNIMDYSLLLGINDETKQIVCGLVDTIGGYTGSASGFSSLRLVLGSYTFAKTLEYKAKQGLNSGKEVTVVPPHEYQERFVAAMDEYFLACPDKWSRPLDDSKIPHDIEQLPKEFGFDESLGLTNPFSIPKQDDDSSPLLSALL